MTAASVIQLPGRLLTETFKHTFSNKEMEIYMALQERSATIQSRAQETEDR